MIRAATTKVITKLPVTSFCSQPALNVLKRPVVTISPHGHQFQRLRHSNI